MKPIVLYLRVSTTEQDLTSQKDDLLRWAKTNNYNVLKVFGEKISAYDLTVERKEYDALKAYVLKYKIKDIGVWEISRLSRSMVQTVNDLDFFTKNGINIHFRKEGIDSLSNSVTNQLLLTILSSLAQMERDTFIERGNRGRMSAVMRGRMIGYSTPPYGYTSDENGLIAIEPTEAKIIELIYDLAIKGTTLYGISEHLNSLNIPTRRNLQGKKRKLKNGNEIEFIWKPSPISRMIKKPIYKGLRLYKGYTISIPAIVSENTWNEAQKRFTDNIGYLNKTKYEYLFKTKLKCGKCDRILVTYKDKKVNYGYYLCTGIFDKGLKCNNGRYINSNLIDTNLYKCIFNHRYIKEIMSREASPAHERDNKLKQIEYYNGEIKSLEMKRKRLNKLYIDGFISEEEFMKETTTHKNTIIDNRNKIKVLNNEINLISSVDINEIMNTYKNATDFTIKRDFVKKYVNEIIINKIDIANVDWKTPLQKNEKIIYAEIYAFSYMIPIKVLLTPYSKNVIVSNDLQYLPDYNMVTDIKKGGKNKPPKNSK